MRGKLIIKDSCMQCGNCMSFGFDFLKLNEMGNIAVKEGTTLDSEDNDFQNLMDSCPVGAFELDAEKDEAVVVNDLIQKLKNFSGLEVPKEESLRFNKEGYIVNIPIPNGEYQYSYNSDRAVESAALNEFNRAMFSQKNALILKLITEYRVKNISPYYTYTEEEGSLYAKKNKELEELLTGLYQRFEKHLPKDFVNVNIFPDDDSIWRMLKKGELFSDEIVSSVISELNRSADDYDCYWTWDSKLVHSGTDFRGNPKYAEKYCYYNMRVAFEEFAKDILNACYYDEWLVQRARETIKSLTERYNEKLLKLVQEKIQHVTPLLKGNKPSVAAALPEKIDGGCVQIANNSLTYNGKRIEEKGNYRLGLTYTKEANYVYDGSHILKCYIENGFLQEDVVLATKHFKYSDVCGGDGFIAFTVDREYGLYLYDCTSDRLRMLDEYAYMLCGCKGKLFYARTVWEKAVFAAKELIMCDSNGEKSRTLDSCPRGIIGRYNYGIYSLCVDGCNVKYQYSKPNPPGLNEIQDKCINVENFI